VLQGLTKDEQVTFHRERLPEIIEKHRERVLMIAETDPKGVAAFIEAEKRKRSGKTEPEAFHVDIEL
jgi:hypothetical protein